MRERFSERVIDCLRREATPRDWRNLRVLMLVMVAWAVVFAGGAQLLRRELVTGGAGWVLAVVVGATGVAVVAAYVRYLRQADEFQRMVHLRGLAFGFGGSWLAIVVYRPLELLGAPPLDRGDALLVMAACYVIGILDSLRRYA